MAYLTGAVHGRVHARKVFCHTKIVLVFMKPGARCKWISDIVQQAEYKKEHPRHEYEQSESAFIQLVNILTDPGQLVVDPMLGSGTTAAACVKTGRRFLGCDIDARAVRVAKARLNTLRPEPLHAPKRIAS
jgi:DNA modification methylase